MAFRNRLVGPLARSINRSSSLFQNLNCSRPFPEAGVVGCNQSQARTFIWGPSDWYDHKWVDHVERRFRDVDRMFNSVFPRHGGGRHGGWSGRHQPWYYIEWDHQSPIVNEDGVKKFKLAFDLSRFRPEEVEIKTKDGKVSIAAKHESKDGNQSKKFEFEQSFTVPDGVNVEEVKGTFMPNGSLVLEAPYTQKHLEPPKEPIKETPIEVKHE